LQFRSSADDLGLRVQRIWREREPFVKLSESGLAAGSDADEPTVGDAGDERAADDGMTLEELAKLKTDAGDMLMCVTLVRK